MLGKCFLFFHLVVHFLRFKLTFIHFYSIASFILFVSSCSFSDMYPDSNQFTVLPGTTTLITPKAVEPAQSRITFSSPNPAEKVLFVVNALKRRYLLITPSLDPHTNVSSPLSHHPNT